MISTGTLNAVVTSVLPLVGTTTSDPIRVSRFQDPTFFLTFSHFVRVKVNGLTKDRLLPGDRVGDEKVEKSKF